MQFDHVQLLFLQLSLANAYDQQDWPTVHEMSSRIDALTAEKARLSMPADKDAM